MVSFAVWKLLNLTMSYLFVFAFVLENGLKNIAIIHVKECSAYVFLKEFYSI